MENFNCYYLNKGKLECGLKAQDIDQKNCKLGSSPISVSEKKIKWVGWFYLRQCYVVKYVFWFE